MFTDICNLSGKSLDEADCQERCNPLRAAVLQLRMGLAVLASLWLIGLPSIYYMAVEQEGGLLALWTTMAPVYVLLNILLCQCPKDPSIRVRLLR